MQRMASELKVEIDESELIRSRTALNEDSDKSSVTHSGRFGSEKSMSRGSIREEEEFDGHNE